MVKAIVTHPGGAHKDDLLAVCVLAARYGAPVYRKDPSPTEIDDPQIAVVDIGGVHDPARLNFDHHHFPREHEPTCALSLLLDQMGLYQDAKQFCDWLEPAEWFDSRGPKKTADWLGVPRRAISQLNSPIDITLLRRFAQCSELHPGDTLYEFMKFVGQDLLDYLRIIRERLNFVGKHVEKWAIPVGNETINALFLPRTEPELDEPSGSLASYIRDQGLEKDIAAIVYPDRRGAGYGIGRYEDHPQLDFAKVQSQPDVHFAHTSGFMCKTSATTAQRLQELIAAAWGPKAP